MSETAFILFGSEVAWLELVAFALALACVGLTVLEIHWGWPLWIASSLLYGWVFFESRLYGEAGLQGVFAALGAWGWWQWLRGAREAPRPSGDADRPADRGLPADRGGDRVAGAGGLRIGALGARGRAAIVAAWAGGWLALGWALGRFTDSPVPWLDAFPTAGSLVGQALLARKYVENWIVWIVVNAASVALFAERGLWPTVLLYAILLAMAVAGWVRWRAAAGRAAPAGTRSR